MRRRSSVPGVLQASAASHPGLRRENNEDRHYCDPARGIFIVIDGVGGEAAGEKAAETALGMLRTRLDRETGGPAERIREAITLANNEVYRLSQLDRSLAGMSCVLTVALVSDGRLTVGHVGDTRLYEFRAGGIRKLTHDHSPVGEREDRGELGESEAMSHPRRNEIFRDVGSRPHSPTDEEFIEVLEQPFEEDSALLLCSDGLSDLVPSATLARLAYRFADDPARLTRQLIQAANTAGGKDNITTIFVAGPRFADSAREVRSARVPRAGRLQGARPGLSRAVDWLRAVVDSRAAFVALGCMLGLVLAASAALLTDAVPGWLLATIRPASWSRTWVVGPDADADVATIGAALGRARPGDTIEVRPGEYPESIVLRGEVALVSQRRHEAVIRAPADGPRPWIAVDIQPGATGRLAGFSIAGSATRPLTVGVMAGDADVEIDDLDISGAESAGISVAPRSRVVIRSSYIHHNAGDGVVIRQGATPLLRHNMIVENGFEHARPALLVHEPAQPTLIGNIFAAREGEPVQGLSPAALAETRRDNIIVEPAAAPARRAPASPAGGNDASPPRTDPPTDPAGRRGAGTDR